MENYKEINCTGSYEKLLKLKWRRGFLEHTLNKDEVTKFGGFTNVKLGPPKELTEGEAQQWRRIMKEAWRNCTRQLLFPHMISEEQKIEDKLVKRIRNIATVEEYTSFREEVEKGIEHAEKKYLNKYIVKEKNIPEPPNRERIIIKQPCKHSFIQRGEKWTREKNGFIKNLRVKERENIYIILAHALYNKKSMYRVVVKKFWEYVNRYEQQEKANFRPFLGIQSNGMRKHIEGWRMYKSYIKNRQLKITGYELEVIARLYCVQIRIMQDKTEWVSYGFRENYKCMWKTGEDGGRVINLLEVDGDKWALLEGIEVNYDRIEVKVKETLSITDIEHIEGEISVREEVNELESIVIQNNQKINKKAIKERENTEIKNVDIRKEQKNEEKGEEKKINEVENVEEINQVEVDRENIIDQNITNSHIEQEYREKIDENNSENIEEINQRKTGYQYTEKELSQITLEEEDVLDVEDITNTQEEDIDSITTTESIKALFYEERDDEIEEDRENREDIKTENSETLGYSRMSTMTMYSVDNVENSIMHMTQRIKSLKVRNKHQLASKTALKNILWQRSRILERNRRRNLAKKREKQDNREGRKIRNIESVFDFTSKGLGKNEIELLSKGESFSIAKNKVDIDRLKVDLYNYTRRLKLKDIAESKTCTEIGEKKTTNLSQFSKITNSQITTQNSLRRISSTSNRLVESPESRESNTHRSTNLQILREANVKKKHQRRSSSKPSQKEERIDIKGSQLDNIDTVQSNDSMENREEYNIQCKIRKLPCTYDPESENRNLLRYNSCIQEEGLVAIKNKIKLKDNITKELREAFEELKKRVTNKEIIITKADKGGGLVILDYELYIKKGTYYIEVESLAYKKVEIDEKDIIIMIAKERNKIVNKLKKEKIIQEQTATYCTHQVEEKITGMKFYYKVHKDDNIQTMPLRPLQSCISGPTHHLSQVLTDLLQPLLNVKNMPTFIQDSNQLLVRLNKLPKLNSEDTIITSDVAALYPSIPHKEGLEAMGQFLRNNSHFTKVQIDIIINALELVITKNYVKWNGDIYEQIKGVAMGTPVAVAYANIFMHWIDTEIKEKATYIIEHMRYIDDNLFVLPENKIEETMEIANSILSPSIRYTYETLNKQGEKGLPFLDTQLFISEELKIESRLYTKKTDKHTYLLPSSYHPIHITKNIPLATFLRLRRICSKDEWFQADAMKAIEWLEDRDYKFNDITRAIGKAIEKDRWELINNIENQRGKKKSDKREQEGVDIIPLIVTYSQSTLQLRTVLKQRQEILDASFTNSKVIPRISFRRQENLGDVIVQRSLRGPITGEEQRLCKFVECKVQQRYRIQCPCKGIHDQKKCRCCVHATFDLKGIKVKLHKEVTCESKNLVYVISCKICKKRYVGETQQKLRDRLMQHLNNIQKLSQPLYTHFKSVHKPVELTISVLETVRGTEPFMRKVREAWWINYLQTLEPRGFNVKLDCNQVYLEDRKKIEKRESTTKVASKVSK